MARVRKLDSHLGDVDWKGKLTIVYPSDGDVSQRKTIPFFENPEITESQTPRYANYSVVGRSSNLFAYLGSDSRKFNLSFNMTLPHILSAPQQKFDDLYSNTSTKIQKRREILQTGAKFTRATVAAQRKAFGWASSRHREQFEHRANNWNPFGPQSMQESIELDPYSAGQGRGQASIWDRTKNYVKQQSKKQAWANYDKKLDRHEQAAARMDAQDRYLAQQQQKWYQGVAGKYDETFYETLSSEEAGLSKMFSAGSPMYDINSEGSKERRRVLNAVASMVAILRSTVINNAEYTQYGPPIVRLDFGILYNDVPCVCKGYTITIDDKAGYDVKTLLPRKFNIRLSLEEARNLSSAASSEPIKDGLVGWEVLLGGEAIPGGSLDPGNFDIKESFAPPDTGLETFFDPMDR
tara:strand:- start:1886 stop:3109 length:1224 start_codon:yes stop_codon:yes gene_type:complete